MGLGIDRNRVGSGGRGDICQQACTRLGDLYHGDHALAGAVDTLELCIVGDLIRARRDCHAGEGLAGLDIKDHQLALVARAKDAA